MKLLQINKYKVHKILNFQDVTYNFFFMKMEDFTKLSCPKPKGMLIYYTFTLNFKYLKEMILILHYALLGM